MKQIVIMLVIAGVAGFGLLNYHFILFDKNLKIIKKTGVRYEDTFVDARGVKKLELALKPELVSAGYKDLVEQMGN